jgi:ribosome biogenesis protein MAK21
MPRAPLISAAAKTILRRSSLNFLFYPAEKKHPKSKSIAQFDPDQQSITRVMAKTKGKRSSTVQASQAENPHDAGESKVSPDENFISLDAGALANLTRNIEQKLKDGKNTANNKSQKRTENSKAGTKKAPANDFKDKKNAAAKTQNSSNSNQGKKRNRDGEVIEKSAKSGSAKNDQTQDDILRKEILALGGSKEDFDLLAEVASDSEVEESASGSNKKAVSNDDALRKELAQLLKDAGQFSAEIADDQVDEEQSASEDGNEEEDEEEENDNEVEDEIESASEADDANVPSKETAKSKGATEVADKKKAALAEAQSQFPKEYSRLVSYLTNQTSDIKVLIVFSRLSCPEQTGTALSYHPFQALK